MAARLPDRVSRGFHGPTFKLRRRVVHAKYADIIGALYAD